MVNDIFTLVVEFSDVLFKFLRFLMRNMLEGFLSILWQKSKGNLIRVLSFWGF